MADVRPDPRGLVDPAINSPGREGLTGTAPASLYAPSLEREQITIAPNFAPADDHPDHPLVTFTDAERPYLQGRVGAYTEDATVKFEDLKVS